MTSSQKDLLRFLTCGNVDDGKSTLIGRLLHDTKVIYEDHLAALQRDSSRYGTTGHGIDLALLTDGLKAEREQGITIDVAYRSFSTDRRRFIIADTPGHEQYTRNMVTGASTCDAAVVLIDARHGVATQTRRHSFILSLLGIKHVVVAVNKMDLVDYAHEVFDRISREYSDFVAKLDIPAVEFIPICALRGDNVVEPSAVMPWYRGPTMLQLLETLDVALSRDPADLRLPVQYVIRAKPDFRGIAGTIASGVLRKGDPVMVLPSERCSTVKSIVTYDGELTEAVAPMAVTVSLDDALDVSRGDMLVHPGERPRIRTEVEALLVWLGENALVRGRSYWLKQTTRTVVAHVSDVRYGVDVDTLDKYPASHLMTNQVGHVVLELAQPICYDAYADNAATGACILIDRMTNNTVGAGMLLARAEAHSGDDPWHHRRFAGWLARQHSRVTSAEREKRLGQRGATVLLYGATDSGSAAIGYALERTLLDAGRAATALSGPGRAEDFGFAPDDWEDVRRLAETAKLLNDSGLICICALAAPTGAASRQFRRVIEGDRLVTVSLAGPVEGGDHHGGTRASRRDDLVHGSSALAAGEASIPLDFEIATGTISVEECVARIVDVLRRRQLIPPV